MDIRINSRNVSVKIITEVKDSLHASILADRLNSLEYLKVYERDFKNGIATIRAYIIRPIFTISKLHNDLEVMTDLIPTDNESIPHSTASN